MSKKLMVALFAIAMCCHGLAQNIQVIPWQDGNGEIYVNSIIDFMVADTSSDGQQLHDIYQLETNGNYVIDQTIDIKNPIHMTADRVLRDDATGAKPPVVRVLTLDDGTASASLFFQAFNSLTVENIYFAGMGTADVWMVGNWLSVQAPDIDIVVDGCTFDYMGWSIVTNFAHENVSYYAYNMYVKNNINAGDPYSPFWVLSIGPKVKNFVARNCTYFQSHGMFMQARNPIDYVEIDHCTFANDLKMQIFNENLTNAKITNNIFYNTLAIGENDTENADKDRDGLPWSIVITDTLPGNEPGGSDPIMPEADRSIIVKNNAWYRTPEVDAFHTDNGLIVGPFMNSRTQAMFDNDAEWPGFDESNNVNEDPGFSGLGAGEWLDEATDSMFAYMDAFRGISGASTFIWGFESDRAEWPTLFRVNVEWPMVENFQHTTLSITDDDGGPIGDQTWFNIYTGIEDEPAVGGPDAALIDDFVLAQNYPNPFNPETTIEYSLKHSQSVSLVVYDITGQVVRTLVSDRRQVAGSHSVVWDGKDNSGFAVPSGVYLYQLTGKNTVAARKMILVK